MKNLVSRFMKDESGATAIEYGLIAAGISLAIIAVVNGLGTNAERQVHRDQHLAQVSDCYECIKGSGVRSLFCFGMLLTGRRQSIMRMRHPDIPRSVLEGLQLSLRDPAGLVCAALILALVAGRDPHRQRLVNHFLLSDCSFLLARFSVVATTGPLTP